MSLPILMWVWAGCCLPSSIPGLDGADPPPPAPPAPPPPAPAPPTEARYAASHVLIASDGAPEPPATPRSEAEAKRLADEVWERLEAGEELEALARELSDAPSAPRGGRIGVYQTGTMMPAFEAAVAGVEPGAHTRPFHTPFGWHVARRDAVIEAEARHLLISWRGASRSTSTRSKAQALERIEAARARLEAGEELEALARELSEDATAPQGGALGLIAPGQLFPSFEDALFALDPGEHSDVVETPYGFHLIERIR